MKLVLPSKKYQQSYFEYIEELGDEERYPFTLDLDSADFEQLLAKLDGYSRGENLPASTVQNTTLWLVDGDNIIGVTNVRHYLSEQIRRCGGHIGLGVRPSYRGKGIGNLLMRYSIEYLNNLGVTQVHIHCYKSNPASAKAIVCNGGVLDSELPIGEQIVQRYIVNAPQ